jgi:hypothetical protein
MLWLHNAGQQGVQRPLSPSSAPLDAVAAAALLESGRSKQCNTLVE